MPNGKPGDHPYTDIVVHGRDIYSPTVSSLVREIAALADETTRRQLADLLFLEYNECADPNVEELQRILTDMRDSFRSEAGKRRFDG
jgi:hypothetical protein